MAGRKKKTEDDEVLMIAEDGPGWTDRQRRFVAEYLRHGDGAKAARRAGYCPDRPEDAGKAAYQLKQKPHIRAYLAEERKRLDAKFRVTNDRIVEELARLAFANMGDFVVVDDQGYAHVDLRDVPLQDFAAINELQVEEYMDCRDDPENPKPAIRVKFKLADKIGALDKLARIQKLYADSLTLNLAGDLVERMRSAQRRARAARGESVGDDAGNGEGNDDDGEDVD